MSKRSHKNLCYSNIFLLNIAKTCVLGVCLGGELAVVGHVLELDDEARARTGHQDGRQHQAGNDVTAPDGPVVDGWGTTKFKKREGVVYTS